MQTLNSIVFGWYPYLCLTVFLFGSLFRFDREQYTWRTGSSQLLRRRQLMWGSNLFHVGILVIFVGHFVGLLTPIWVFDMLGVSHGFKQMLAIVAGGLAGLMCLVGISLLTHRRLFDPRSTNRLPRNFVISTPSQRLSGDSCMVTATRHRTSRSGTLALDHFLHNLLCGLDDLLDHRHPDQAGTRAQRHPVRPPDRHPDPVADR